jgi:hypothetical protein
MSLPGHDHNLESFAVAKVYGASWNMMVAEADEPIPLDPFIPLHGALTGLPGN